MKLFPFLISYEPLTGAADMSGLLDAPAGKHGRVRVANGHFATDKGRIRFNAVNLTGPANFPSHRYAERMAARLASLGVNCVRLHFMDCQKGYGSFMQERQPCLLKNGDDPLAYEIDPSQFERLDYLAAQFKKRGIFLNVNLHVARLMAYLLEKQPNYKGATWFARTIVESEKKWARDFLGHFNPHTGMTWADDPVVAVVELNNEDALLCRYQYDVHMGWPPPFADELKARFGGHLPGAGEMTPEFVRFLQDTEEAYVAEMKDFIHGDLGCAAPVTATQVNYTSLWSQLAADYFDDHAYWCHPSPVDADWTILDAPQVNYPANNCITRLLARSAAGRPHTVSEYNNPYPNRYGAEGQLLLHAYGAFQDWDGIFAYSYDNRVDSEPDHVEYFFSLVARTDVLAHFPACAALFLRGDVAPARTVVKVGATRERWIRRFAEDWNKSIPETRVYDDITMASEDALPHALGLIHGTRLDVGGQASPDPAIAESASTAEASRVWKSDTGELVWDISKTGAGYCLVAAENAKVFTGFVRGRTFDLGGGVTLEVGPTDGDWATVSLVSHEATGFGAEGRPARILLAATGLARNAGAKVSDEGKSGEGDRIVSTRGADWGRGPFEVEGVPAKVTLPAPAGKTAAWALDGAGRRIGALPVSHNADGRAVIAIGPEWKTVWYEIAVG